MATADTAVVLQRLGVDGFSDGAADLTAKGATKERAHQGTAQSSEGLAHRAHETGDRRADLRSGFSAVQCTRGTCCRTGDGPEGRAGVAGDVAGDDDGAMTSRTRGTGRGCAPLR